MQSCNEHVNYTIFTFPSEKTEGNSLHVAHQSLDTDSHSLTSWVTVIVLGIRTDPPKKVIYRLDSCYEMGLI